MPGSTHPPAAHVCGVRAARHHVLGVGGCPSRDGEVLPLPVQLDTYPRVGVGVVGQGVEPEAAEAGALVRFGVDRLALPRLRVEEQPEPALAVLVAEVHGRGERQRPTVQVKADLLASLAADRARGVLVIFQLP